jgi:hypothetical protein
MERGVRFFTFRSCVWFTVGFARSIPFHTRAAVADLPTGFSRGFGGPLSSSDITPHYTVSDSPPRGFVAI